jgi:hypothetical protein
MRRFAPRVIAFTGISDRLAAESVSKVSGIRTRGRYIQRDGHA